MGAPRHLSYLDALRGWAIVLVISLHVSQAYADLPWPLVRILATGVQGVCLFFVVSAFTLTLSWTERGDGPSAFYLRRLFRIGPMWWLALAAWTAGRDIFTGSPFPLGLDIRDVLASAGFVHGWVPRAINAAVPGGWSIAAEAMFYLIFPLLVALLTTPVRAISFSLMAVLFDVVAETKLSPLLAPVTSPDELHHFFFLWFPNQLPAFTLGMAAFHAARLVKAPRWVAEFAVALSVCAFIALPLLGSLHEPIAYGALFAMLTWGMAEGGGRYLGTRVLGWIGERSYSAYFWHFAIVLGLSELPMPFVIRLALVFAVTFLLSSLSHRLIEQPGIALGSRLMARLRRTPTATIMIPRVPRRLIP